MLALFVIVCLFVCLISFWNDKNRGDFVNSFFARILHPSPLNLGMVPKKGKSKRKTIRQQYTARKLVRFATDCSFLVLCSKEKSS